MVHIGNRWDALLAAEFAGEDYLRLRTMLKQEYRTQTVYPDMHDIFRALMLCDYDDVQVVILGQDPYHGPGQAHGLAFSVQPGVPAPPSLQNIFKELCSELGLHMPQGGCLEPWARQGVLLLNTALTVRRGAPNSHRTLGWDKLTDRIISLLGQRERPMVFLLWGAHARGKAHLVGPQHLVLQAPHPSPLSAHAGFFGCGHFLRANEFLAQQGVQIDWQIE